MGVIRQCVKTLALRACALLVLEKPNDAFDDLKQALYLSDISKDEPMAGSRNRRLPCRYMINSALLSGLVRHRWTDSQLQWFQSRFEKEDFPREGYRYLMAERAHYLRVIDQLRKSEDTVTLGARNSFDYFAELEWDVCLFMVAHMEGAGWFYRQAVDYSRSFDKASAPMASWLKGECDAQQCLKLLREEYASCIRSMPQGLLSIYRAKLRHRLLTGMFLRNYSLDFIEHLHMQVQTKQATIGCALERYYLFHNRYPETLEELTPRYLSSLSEDSFSGKPFKYRREGAGSYTPVFGRGQFRR